MNDVFYKIGDLFLVQRHVKVGVYMLVQVAPSTCTMISMTDGNRYRNETLKVKSPFNVTPADMYLLTNGALVVKIDSNKLRKSIDDMIAEELLEGIPDELASSAASKLLKSIPEGGLAWHCEEGWMVVRRRVSASANLGWTMVLTSKDNQVMVFCDDEGREEDKEEATVFPNDAFYKDSRNFSYPGKGRRE